MSPSCRVTLWDVLKAVNRFPYRSGGIDGIFVSSCCLSNVDFQFGLQSCCAPAHRVSCLRPQLLCAGRAGHENREFFSTFITCCQYLKDWRFAGRSPRGTRANARESTSWITVPTVLCEGKGSRTAWAGVQTRKVFFLALKPRLNHLTWFYSWSAV